MSTRKYLFSSIFVILLILITEISLRLALSYFGYPLLLPAKYLEKKFYPYLIPLQQKVFKPEKDVKNILILGGSVVNTDWTRMESRLDTLLQKQYPGIKKMRFFNVAMPGHTSRDNLIKYELLENQTYDLVIFYEAINENRANNIPEHHFYPDYSHMKWYDDINTLRTHREINFTVIPYVFHLVVKNAVDRIARRDYISSEGVDPEYYTFGSNIKSASSYFDNVGSIARLAQKKGDKLLLVKYASYFPENVTLTGGEEDKKYFTPCYVVSPVTTWGKPEHVKKGIDAHNDMLKKVVHSEKTYFFDMAATLPRDSSMFCDVCHLSESGAQYFARELSKCIVSNKLLD